MVGDVFIPGAAAVIAVVAAAIAGWQAMFARRQVSIAEQQVNLVEAQLRATQEATEQAKRDDVFERVSTIVVALSEFGHALRVAGVLYSDYQRDNSETRNARESVTRSSWALFSAHARMLPVGVDVPSI